MFPRLSSFFVFCLLWFPRLTYNAQVLSEVHVLAQLNHPYVVRYFGAWPEDEPLIDSNGTTDSTSSGGADFLGSVDERSSPSFSKSGRGLDFISSSGYPKIEFGYDEEDEAAVSGDDTSTENDASETSLSVEPADVGLRRVRYAIKHASCFVLACTAKGSCEITL